MLPILESIEVSLDLHEEGTRPVKTKVVRKGELKIKWVCQPGFMYDSKSKSCKRMTETDRKKRRKSAKKAKKTKKLNKHNIAISSKKSRKKSDRVRKSRNLDKR
ncbi:MAG: hypothetical protein DRG78_03425 [Epsilonproteobacteria bacterium]|nr:MAG: hypothetical protein DRG78_03425 [Campylobacterota bacterium]